MLLVIEMKLTIKKEDRTREFYDELLYISSKYPTLLKKPETKMHKSTLAFGIYNLLALLFLIVFFLIYLKTKKIIMLILFIQMILMFIISLIYYIGSFRFIKKEMSSKEDSELTINNSGVRITKGKELDYTLKYDDIAHIIINKYNYSFVPKTRKSLIISVSNNYKKEINKELKDLKKDKLIVDNTDLYK